MNNLLCPTEMGGLQPPAAAERRASADIATAPPLLEKKLKLPTEAKHCGTKSHAEPPHPVAAAPRPTSLNIRRTSVASHTESPLPSRKADTLSDAQVPVRECHVLLLLRTMVMYQ